MAMDPRTLLLIGCATLSAACLDLSPASERNRLVMLAPEEAQPLLEQVLQTYYAARGNQLPVATFGLSSEIVRQAARDEGVHLLVTTHPAWADYVRDRREVLDRAAFATDRLVVAGIPGVPAPKSADVSVRLLDGSIQHLAAPSTESDSVGMYAREAFLRYGIWSRVRPSIEVTAGTAQAVAALRAGQADAAVLFASMADREQLPVIATIDDAYHQPIRFEVLLLSDANTLARPLFDFLATRAVPLGGVAERAQAR